MEEETNGVKMMFLVDSGAAAPSIRGDAWERVNASNAKALYPWSGQRPN